MTKVDGLMGPRLSTNLSVERQTPKTSFGDRVQAGVNAAAGAVANGVGLATSMLPGGGIVSAAVSSVQTFSGSSGSGMTATPYASALTATTAGATNVGVPSVNTTVGGGGTGGVTIPGAGAPNSPNYLAGSNGAAGAEFNGEMASMFAEQRNLLKLQSVMQRENQVFTTISNVMKTRHDTTKNSIGNIR